MTDEDILRLYKPESHLYGLRWDEAISFARAIEKLARWEASHPETATTASSGLIGIGQAPGGEPVPPSK
jgi:hypothetical protein